MFIQDSDRKHVIFSDGTVVTVPVPTAIPVVPSFHQIVVEDYVTENETGRIRLSQNAEPFEYRTVHWDYRRSASIVSFDTIDESVTAKMIIR